ncbi:hypothetical protein GCM10028818_11990 [Spirosoma horti]
MIVKMLVGKGDANDAQEAILDEVVKELRQLDSDLWETINEVVSRMNTDRFFIRDARSISNPFHCKFYIGDNKFLWHGSANYSENGLSGKARSNAEQVSLLVEPDQIADFTKWFDATAKDSKDILTPVRDLLEQWLKMAEPFDVYLKALSVMLSNNDEESRPFAPVYFQQFIIRNALRQAEEYGGSLIVAATGLGKTIIGSEIARHLQNTGVSKRTLVIAPPIVHPKWEEQLRIKDINYFIYSTTVAFLASTGKANHQITDLEKELERADAHTVILIDEAHYYRNQRTNERLHQRASRVYTLFVPAVAKGAKIFLLTATAYGTNIHNLNGLLHLLPHKAPKPELFSETGPWEVKKPDEFINLPVVTVLGLPHVLSLARQMNHIDDAGRTYIRYGSRQVYLPKTMRLKPIFYRLPLDQSVQAAFNDKYFAQAGKFTTSFIDENTDEIVKGPVDTLQKIALTSWLSSPEALLEVITYNLRTPSADDVDSDQTSIFPITDSELGAVEEDIVDTNEKRYKVLLRRPKQERKKQLGSIQAALKSGVKDDKYNCLTAVINERFIQSRSKILIFIRRYPTANYLQKLLQQTYDNRIFVSCMVEQDEKGVNKLRKAPNRQKNLKDFSPSAHNHHKPDQEIDILICTDADSLGVDLPDVDTIVNYDSPESADILFQRAGRIMRMTENADRIVYFYTFIPSMYNEPDILSECRTDIKKRFNRLIDRHKKSTQIIGTDVLSHSQELNVLLEDTIDVEHFTRDEDVLESIGGLGSKAMLAHSLMLDKHRERSQLLPNFLHSATVYDGIDKKLFLLLHHAEKEYPILYNLNSKELELLSDLRILDTIRCLESTPRALVNVAEIEQACCQAAESWCKRYGQEDMSKPEKVCALLLVPKSLRKDDLINEFVKNRSDDEDR